MANGGWTPFSTPLVQDSSGIPPVHSGVLLFAAPVTTETGTRAVENGVDPPFP